MAVGRSQSSAETRIRINAPQLKIPKFAESGLPVRYTDSLLNEWKSCSFAFPGFLRMNNNSKLMKLRMLRISPMISIFGSLIDRVKTSSCHDHGSRKRQPAFPSARGRECEAYPRSRNGKGQLGHVCRPPSRNFTREKLLT